MTLAQVLQDLLETSDLWQLKDEVVNFNVGDNVAKMIMKLEYLYTEPLKKVNDFVLHDSL